MKLPNILLTSAVCCLCVCFFGCTAQDSNSSTTSRLNEWQMNLLEAEGLPTEYDQLTVKQQNTIDRVWKMICDVKMSEMEDGKFQWKYGASNRIFLLEEFAVEYAQFLYDHELSGRHRIEVLREFPEDEAIWAGKGGDIYGSPDR